MRQEWGRAHCADMKREDDSEGVAGGRESPRRCLFGDKTRKRRSFPKARSGEMKVTGATNKREESTNNVSEIRKNCIARSPTAHKRRQNWPAICIDSGPRDVRAQCERIVDGVTSAS